VSVRDTQYEDLLRRVHRNGTEKTDRTGTGTRSLSFRTLHYDLAEGFPLITTKRVHFRSVALELLWFLRGEQTVTWLQEQGVTIWDEWADEEGHIGPMYGWQWRHWGGFQRSSSSYTGDGTDQIAAVIEGLRRDPDGRRHVVSAWNVTDLPEMALAPCHAFFQFIVQDGRLDCGVTQRSADMFLGVPYNIASYALLTHMMAAQTGLEVGELTWMGGDCHVYANHDLAVSTQLGRDVRPFPTLTLDPAASIDDYTLDHIHLHDYDHHPAIKAPVAV
jgi:thymidylate synthase